LAVENADLLESGRSMQVELARAERMELEATERADSLEACLAAETERLEALLGTEGDRAAGISLAEGSAKTQALAIAQLAALKLELDNERIARVSEHGVLVQARIEAEISVMRWRVAAGVGLFFAIGPLLALAAGNAPVLATGPKLTIASKAATPGSDEGYRAALDAMTIKAARLEAEGKLVEARTVWTCVAAMAVSPNEIRAASQRAGMLRGRADGSAAVTKSLAIASSAATPTQADEARVARTTRTAVATSTTPTAAWPVMPVARPATALHGPNGHSVLAAAGKAAMVRQKAVHGGGVSRIQDPAAVRAAAPRLPGFLGGNRPLSAELDLHIAPPPVPPPVPLAAEPVHGPGDDYARSDDPIPASVRAKF
jgi:hypothetical protein